MRCLMLGAIQATCLSSSGLCSGEVLSDHENLVDFLQQVQEKYRRHIWNDAICVSQKDDDEKNHPIPLMGEVYSKATRVLVWLGSNSRNEDKSCAVISILAENKMSALLIENIKSAKRTLFIRSSRLGTVRPGLHPL